jgi:hypothetical protein
MKSKLKMEDGILGVAAFACYLFALMACAVATYALVVLSLTAQVDLGQGAYLRAAQF